MKKYVTIALFIFWVIVTGLFIVGLLLYQKVNEPVGSSASPSGAGIVLNESQLAEHKSAESCWLLLSGKIYDVSNYISTHPGGADIIIKYCGTDSTNAFATKGGGRRDHSVYAYSLLADYYIGDLGQISKQSAAIASTAPAIATGGAVKADALKPAIVKPAMINLSASELVKHNSISDCWLLINGKVYNVTNYLNSHPGGVGTITPYCGADSTGAFTTKGGRGAHSGFAWNILNNYYVGDLGRAVSQTQTQTAPVNNRAGLGTVGWQEDDND